MATLELEDGSTIKVRKSLKVEPDGGVIVDGKYYPPVEEPQPDVTITLTATEVKVMKHLFSQETPKDWEEGLLDTMDFDDVWTNYSSACKKILET